MNIGETEHLKILLFWKSTISALTVLERRRVSSQIDSTGG